MAGAFLGEVRRVVVAAFKVSAFPPFSDELLDTFLTSNCTHVPDRAKQRHPCRINARQVPAEVNRCSVAIVRMEAHAFSVRERGFTRPPQPDARIPRRVPGISRAARLRPAAASAP